MHFEWPQLIILATAVGMSTPALAAPVNIAAREAEPIVFGSHPTVNAHSGGPPRGLVNHSQDGSASPKYVYGGGTSEVVKSDKPLRRREAEPIVFGSHPTVNAHSGGPPRGLVNHSQDGSASPKYVYGGGTSEVVKSDKPLRRREAEPIVFGSHPTVNAHSGGPPRGLVNHSQDGSASPKYVYGGGTSEVVKSDKPLRRREAEPIVFGSHPTVNAHSGGPPRGLVNHSQDGSASPKYVYGGGTSEVVKSDKPLRRREAESLE